jgi:DNA invertase Pin-like site-specific DNA recombinase
VQTLPDPSLARPAPRFVAYYRVSTGRQARSGLGLDAQRFVVEGHVAREGGAVIGEAIEVESGRRDERPKLREALGRCRALGATLLIAKLDRLARDVHFISGLMKEGVPFVACDMPNATPIMLHIHAAMSEEEARAISARTKAALAAAKARGTKLGNPRLRAGSPELARIATAEWSARCADRAAQVFPYVEQARRAGATSLRAIADMPSLRAASERQVESAQRGSRSR